jgi:amino acid adenylation domain-containing protein/thioester reductase-like protein
VWQDLLDKQVHRDDNFFALGGNSLLAVTIAHRLSKQLNRKIAARDLFASPILVDFAKKVAQAQTSNQDVPQRSDIATAGELEFWTAEKAKLDTRTFIILVQQQIQGQNPSAATWEAAWAKIVARHGAFRTYYREDTSATLRRRLINNNDFTDNALLQHSEVANRKQMLEMVRQWQSEPLQMSQAPLWRAGIVTETQTGSATFWLAMHHAIGDGRSVGIILQDLAALVTGEHRPQPQTDLDEAAWSYNTYLGSANAEQDRQYWQQVMKPVPLSSFDEWPLDHDRQEPPQVGTHRLKSYLSSQQTQGLLQLAADNQASLHALMLTLLALETKRRTGREHFILGTTASSRETAQDNQIVGCFVNMLPLPYSLTETVSFSQLLAHSQQQLMAALVHERIPFAQIYHDVWAKNPSVRHPLRFPLFDLVVTENPAPGHIGDIFAHKDNNQPSDEYEFTPWPPGQDMALIHERQNNGALMLEIHVNAEVYQRDSAQAWFDAIVGWAKWLAQNQIENPAQTQAPLPALLPQEITWLNRWQQGKIIERPTLCVHQLFEQHAKATPNAPAIIVQDQHISYEQLNRYANQIAHALICAQLKPGETVAVLSLRSSLLAAAMLGCFKAGGVYLPLAVDLPAGRLSDMVQVCDCRLLIALDDHPVPPLLASEISTVLRPEQFEDQYSHTNPEPVNGLQSAYILFTSGSTGRPKGTRVSHKAYVNLVLGMIQNYRMTANDRSLMFSSPSFDVSLSDIGVPLACGAALCPVSTQALDSPLKLIEWINQQQITIIDITPSYLRLLSGAQLPSVRILITGGEAPFSAEVAEHAKKRCYFNAYGPTENTITSAMGQLTGDETSHFGCGHPLPNTQIEIRHNDGTLVPPGVTGEVWLGGDNLAIEYVKRPKETADAFVMTDDGRRYRTGDLGRWGADGQLQVLGRADEQVKLNGIRVETSEIEAIIVQHPDVTQAVVVISFDAKRSHRLAAFVTLTAGTDAPTSQSWPKYLQPHLPAYMIPSSINVVAAIPINHSGKIDKKALLNHLPTNANPQALTVPSDTLSQLVAKVWSTHLGCQTIHLEDNFFALGGHSLLAIAVANDLEQQLDYAIAARELFVTPTLAGFTEQVKRAAQDQQTSHRQCDIATAGQQEFWIAQQTGHDTRGFNLVLTLKVSGKNLPTDLQWSNAWKQLVERHDTLRTSFYQDDNNQLHCQVSDIVNHPFELAQAQDFKDAQTQAKTAQSHAFDMASGPLWRAGLIKINQDSAIFWLSLHHAIADGWSLGVLSHQLQLILNGSPLGSKPPPYALVAAQEFDYLDNQQSQPDSGYWRQVLSDIGNNHDDNNGAFDEWPLDMPRPLPSAPSKGCHCIRINLAKSSTTGLRQLAKRNGATLHSVMLTLMALEVKRRTQRDRFVLGTVASRRESQAQANAVGYYINMLPIPCAIDPQASIDSSVQTMQANLAQGLTHQRYPFAQICADFSNNVVTQRHSTRMPIFDFAVTQNPAIEGDDQANDQQWTVGLVQTTNQVGELNYQQLSAGPAQDMVLIHQSRSDGALELILFANANIYHATTAKAWLETLNHWATALGQNNIDSSQTLPELTEQETQWLAQRHGQSCQWPATTFHQAFAQIAKNNLHKPALICANKTISYGSMNRLTDNIARQLIMAGAVNARPVAVLTERSVDLPTMALAIFKAGGCYLPISASLPLVRMGYIAQDANPSILVILDDHPIPKQLAHLPTVRFDGEQLNGQFKQQQSIELPQVSLQQPAYIIYTSGSTGTPKGVMLSHQGWNNFAHGVADKLSITNSDKVLLCASVSFDGWVSDLGMAWVAGAALTPVTREQMNDIPAMKALIKRIEITQAVLPPSYLRLFNHQGFEHLKGLMTIGEPPQASDIAFYSNQLHYFNGYGPTENTGATTIGLITAEQSTHTRPHAGSPLNNVQVYILDDNQCQRPPGTIGHIWTGGDNLGLGYLNAQEKTDQVFVETGFGRLYNTGDLGRWNAQGHLEILGRADGQIKLRGQRIELGEIEARLEQYQGVAQAAVLVEDNNDVQTLWAFVLLNPDHSEPDQARWRQFISETLPSYMVPAAVITVKQMPMTLAGKLDQAALLLRVNDLRQLNDEYDAVNRTPPCNDTEIHIAQLWQSQFPGSKISREDDFFALGGDSLRVIAVINALRNDYECSVNQLYENPVLADFAAGCRRRSAHLLRALKAAKADWTKYYSNLGDHERARQQALMQPLEDYQQQNRAYDQLDLSTKRDYRYILLTGATGYLGAYLLQTLLTTTTAHITVLIRGDNDDAARIRLESVLQLYFDQPTASQTSNSIGSSLAFHQRLSVYSADLRHPNLGLTTDVYQQLSDSVDAIYHSAANVNHFGHYHELYASNVTATGHLIDLAAKKVDAPADFHHISTISVVGNAPQSGFHLFSEYSPSPQVPANNYYIRTKQAAEQLVIEARSRLTNATIHRVGNVVFAADHPVLQKGVKTNAFFRQMAAFIQIGKVPDDMHVWLCHVDYLAKALIAISTPQALCNETHHLEHGYRHTVSGLLTSQGVQLSNVYECGFGEFLQRLIDTHEDSLLAAPHAELVEAFGLIRAKAPQPNGRRLEVITERSQSLLNRLNFNWPAVPVEGLKQLLSNAQTHFSQSQQQNNKGSSSC